MEIKQLINTARLFIDRGFMEENLKVNANLYVTYKFNESIHFAKLTNVFYEVFRENPSAPHKIGVMTITELIILAADIMDDMQDDDTEKDVPWNRVPDGQNLNIIIGLLLISLKELIALEGEDSIQQVVYQALLKAISGQQLDLNNLLTSEADYFQVASMKSGSLIAVACLLGTGKVDDVLDKQISEAAAYLGILFQVRNDVSDIKNGFIKSDIVLKKRTLPILYYLNTADANYKNIQDYYLDRVSKVDLSIVHKDIVNGEAFLYCRIVEKIMLEKYEQVIQQLDILEEDKGKLFNIW